VAGAPSKPPRMGLGKRGAPCLSSWGMANRPPNRRPALPAFVLALGLAAGGPAAGRDIQAGPLTFSDVEGGFTLVSVTGRGTVDDPVVVVEEITDPLGGTLVIRGLDRLGNIIGTHHNGGFALTKVVTNRTGEPWHVFDMELQEVQGVPSDRGDGLSFGQSSAVGKPFRSDVFPNLVSVEEPLDRLTFADAVVEPGEQVSFRVVVTDTTPLERFYLVQRRIPAVVALPRRLELAGRLCQGCAAE